jgi:hypothetical protein
MLRAARFPLAVGVLAFLLACQSDTVTRSTGAPLFAVSDGAHEGNPDFFFLPPLFESPNSDPDFDAAAFNGDLRPTVEICQLGGTREDAVRSCAALVRRFAGSEVSVNPTEQHYQVDWNTTESTLDVAKDYRIRVLIGVTELGFTDVDPVNSGNELKSVPTGEFIGLVDGRTLPIKFRIEDRAVCDPDATACATETIHLADGGTIELEDAGEDFLFDIPAGTTATSGGHAVTDVTFNLEVCDGIDVDLPVFGQCLRVTTFFESGGPPAPLELSNPALISMCVLEPGLPELQENLITLHQQDGALIRALPHAAPNCDVIGARTPESPGLLARVWRSLRQFASTAITPRPLYAGTRMVVFNLGAGGETDLFGESDSHDASASQLGPQLAAAAAAVAVSGNTVSDFQFAQPAKMDIIKGTSGLQTLIGTAVATAPAVLVTDLNNAPVVGARVRFLVTGGGGTVNGAGTEVVVLSSTEGIAALTSWSVGAEPARNTVRALGRGIADPVNNGPRTIFDPYVPDITLPPADEAPVTVGLGSLEFVAFGATPTTTILRSEAPLAVFGAPLTLTAAVSSAPPTAEEPMVEFLDGTTSLGLATTNGSGVATLTVTDLSLAPHTLSARFLGTATRFASTSGDVTQHVIRRFDDLASFTAALGGAATQSQDLDGLALGTPIATLIPTVLDIGSTFGTLEVQDCSGSNAVFGFDGATRAAGNGRYDLIFGAARNALAFDVRSQDPATGPAQVEVQTGAGAATFPVSNTSGSESTPTFLGFISSVAFDRILFHEGLEVGGVGNEEVCLDRFLTGSVSLP